MSHQEKLEIIKQDIIKNMVCPLKDAATNIVFGKGNADTHLLFIGEAPGEKEDLQGLPFVGAAGKQLDKLLNAIGLTIDDVYIANILKYRPPQNREPQPDEIIRHTPYLIRQIDVIEPTVIVTLGNYSTKFVLAGFEAEHMDAIPGISMLHGKPQTIEVHKKKYIVVPLYHPAAMLYNPNLRPVMEQDFQIIKQYLNKPAEKNKPSKAGQLAMGDFV